MQNKPPYSITSVDHALRLATLLQQEGPLRVTDAAELLGVSPSTAHRLLAMLVYRGFAEQGQDRLYRAGEALRPLATAGAPVALLRKVALPHLEDLMERTQESANLMVVAGTEARFVATVECQQALRVGDREGRIVPAHLASGGKAVLAAMPPDDVSRLYDGSEQVDLTRLRRELALVRKRGFAVNDQRTEVGVTALGRSICDSAGAPVAAISLAIPTARFDRSHVPDWTSALGRTTHRIEQQLRRT